MNDGQFNHRKPYAGRLYRNSMIECVRLMRDYEGLQVDLPAPDYWPGLSPVPWSMLWQCGAWKWQRV